MDDSTNLLHRKSIRYKGYDYSQTGWYYVTICVHNKECLFGDIENRAMALNAVGTMIHHWWLKIPNKFKARLEEYVIMPNHLHGIIVIHKNFVREDPRVLPSPDIQNQMEKPMDLNGGHSGPPVRNSQNLSSIIQWFKTMTTNVYIRNVKMNNWPRFNKYLWHRSFYDHIIRNEQDYLRIKQYIYNNPRNWEEDEENPNN